MAIPVTDAHDTRARAESAAQGIANRYEVPMFVLEKGSSSWSAAGFSELCQLVKNGWQPVSMATPIKRVDADL